MGPAFSPAPPLTPETFVINGMDFSLLALNNARRIAEKAHDFYYSKRNLTLSIASTGSSIMNAEGLSVGGLTVTGTLSPNITSLTFTQNGFLGGFPLFASELNAFVIFNNGTTWIISSEGFQPTNYWALSPNSSNPSGSYAPFGAYTGTATVSGESQYLGVKRIETVQLALQTGDLIPIEFLTDDVWRDRVMRLYGRQPWNAGLTSQQLGIAEENPVCYQQGQNLFLVPPSQFTYPVTATLSCYQWLPDYTQSSDTDFFTEYAPDYLQWQGILELNKLTKWFTQRREGNIDETNIQAEAQASMQSLLAWDLSVSGGTSTPNAPLAPLPPLAPSQSQVAA